MTVGRTWNVADIISRVARLDVAHVCHQVDFVLPDHHYHNYHRRRPHRCRHFFHRHREAVAEHVLMLVIE